MMIDVPSIAFRRSLWLQLKNIPLKGGRLLADLPTCLTVPIFQEV